MTGFEFSAALRDNDTDSGTDTVVLSYKNPIATGATGSLSFDIQYGVQLEMAKKDIFSSCPTHILTVQLNKYYKTFTGINFSH